MIDVENVVIVDVEATPARTYDEGAVIERTEERLHLKPNRHAADTAYGTGGCLVCYGIALHTRVGGSPSPYVRLLIRA